VCLCVVLFVCVYVYMSVCLCSVALAVKRSGLLEQFPEIQFPDVQVGVFSKKTSLDGPLHEGDRVEVYRPLTIDPKQARLLRAERNKGK